MRRGRRSDLLLGYDDVPLLRRRCQQFRVRVRVRVRVGVEGRYGHRGTLRTSGGLVMMHHMVVTRLCQVVTCCCQVRRDGFGRRRWGEGVERDVVELLGWRG